MFEKLVRWILFGVIIAVLPIIFNYVSAIGKNIPVSLQSILAKGELLLVSAGIAGAGIGELFGRGTANYKYAKIISGGCCVLVLVMTCLWYADVATAASMGKQVNEAFIAKASGLLFFFTLISSGSCVALSEV